MEPAVYNMAVRISAEAEADEGRRWHEDWASRLLVHQVAQLGYEVIDGAADFRWWQPEGDPGWVLRVRAYVMRTPDLGTLA